MKKDMSLKNRNILISGAGIAGPTLAYWLSRYGFHPTVVEQASTLRDGGYAVDIRGAALKVIERMGLLAKVRLAHTHMQGMMCVNSANKPLAHITPEMMAGCGDPDVEIMRGDLARMLYAASKDTTEYLWSDSITSISQNDHGVRVTFKRGQPRIFDLVVGADGIHSKVRARTFEEESQFMRYLGYYVALFTTANFLHLDRQELVYRMPGKLASMYSARHNTEAKATFYFASPQLYYDRHDTEQQKRILADTFAGEGWEIPRLLGSMRDAPDFYLDSIDQIRMDSWSKGRVVLVGDASYCASTLSGQGTSLALVGAYVLAGELAAAAGDHRTAFATYEKEMRDYVELNQKRGASNGKQFLPPTRLQIWFANQNMRMLPYLPWKGLILKAIQRPYHAITLKDYEGGSTWFSQAA